jgi:hypothetical protein
MKSLRIYLCGSIKKGAEEKKPSFWSAEDIRTLRESAAPTELVVLNPASRADDLSDVHATFGRDLLQVYTSDVVVADARHRRGVGVGAELLFAKSHRIPVVTIAPRESHYHRSDVVLMGQFVEVWLHPFISELSDAVAENVEEAARLAVSITDSAKIRGPECFQEAMLHYVTTQRHREPQMVDLLTEDSARKRSADLISTLRGTPA